MTDILGNGTYNITALVSINALEDTSDWVYTVLNMIGPYVLPIILTVIGIVLFTLMRKVGTTSETEAASYAGVIISITAVLLFFVNTSSGNKLISWEQALPIFILTAVIIGFHKMNKDY